MNHQELLRTLIISICAVLAVTIGTLVALTDRPLIGLPLFALGMWMVYGNVRFMMDKQHQRTDA